jgi:hypothetical protein
MPGTRGVTKVEQFVHHAVLAVYGGEAEAALKNAL